MVSSLWPPETLGGAESHAAALAARLVDRGDEVAVMTGGVDAPDVIASVVPRPYRLDSYAGQSAARRLEFHVRDVFRRPVAHELRRAIEDFDPDVVHSHAVAGLSAAVLAEPTRLGVAHVHTLHDYWLRCERSTLVRRDGSPCARRCASCRLFAGARSAVVARHPPDVVLAVSEAVANAHQSLGWLADRTRILYNPVDDDPRSPEVPAPPATFGFVGRLTREKGVTTLARGFGAAALFGSRLLIAGEGPLERALSGLGVPGVELLGRIDLDQRDRLLGGLHALVVPSEWEDPAPLVVNEARARRVPVIGAASGGIPELVSPACRDLLFPPGDVGALAERLTRVAQDPGAFVADDRADVLSWDAHVDGVLQAYADARSVHS
jgi:glycosyltransferase involved in cell wall biosynthesis